ncbi:CBS domain-containing protein [Thermotoga profunda]|uniref:CBS domain-containing protein n=1 Tax=Thermotoga profunda TaxID=1508420 RepID=UPI000597614A|nr:CBS domain-containing protein [Thermotoga profunda]
MFARNWINTDFPQAKVSATVQEVLSTMRKYRVDYCIVTDEENKFEGLVYKNSLANLQLDSTIGDYVIFPDFYVFEDSYIEEAALTFRESQEACLAVVDSNLVVKGVITLTEILEAFVAITAMDEPGSRILLKLEDKPGQLKRVFDVLAQNKMNVLAVNTVKEDNYRRVSIKVDVLDPEEVAKVLEIYDIKYDKIAKEEGF